MKFNCLCYTRVLTGLADLWGVTDCSYKIKKICQKIVRRKQKWHLYSHSLMKKDRSDRWRTLRKGETVSFWEELELLDSVLDRLKIAKFKIFYWRLLITAARWLLFSQQTRFAAETNITQLRGITKTRVKFVYPSPLPEF